MRRVCTAQGSTAAAAARGVDPCCHGWPESVKGTDHTGRLLLSLWNAGVLWSTGVLQVYCRIQV